MLIQILISKLKERYKAKQYLKKLLMQNVQLCYPFDIYKKENLILGKNIYIGPNPWLILRGKLFIDDGTIIGPRIKVHTSNHNYESNMIPYNDEYIIKDVKIGKNVWIGADVTLLPGIQIGDGAIVGACTCVTKDVPPYSIIGGNPGRILKYRNIENYNDCLAKNQIYLEKKFNGETEIND